MDSSLDHGGYLRRDDLQGYLQRQFIALTRNVPAGILLSAAAFGAGHAYQGFRMVILIGLFGAMLGFWPIGEEAFAWNDRPCVA